MEQNNNNNEVKDGVIKKVGKLLIKLIIIAIFIVGIAGALKIAPNYVKNDITDRTNLIINCSNVTGRMKQNLIKDENGVIYLSMEDIKNYYDSEIYFDEEYNQIVTSSKTKLAVLKLDEDKMTINGTTQEINSGIKVKGTTYYLPISEMQEVYNIKISEAENKVVMESLDKKLTSGKATKKLSIKYKPTIFSRTIEKIEKGDKVVIAEIEKNSLPSGWLKVRTENGNIGYVEEKNLNNIQVEREDKTYAKQINGKVSMAWEYFSKYGSAPDNTGKVYNGVNVVSPSFFYLELEDTGKENLNKLDVISQAKVKENVGDKGQLYIQWAHNNGYKVWAKVSNDTIAATIDEFSLIINDYKLRELLIKDILNYSEKYNLDGINLDFEYVYKQDKDALSKFIIELAPQLRNKGICLSVDVTAPNGGDNWSLCYDRNLIGEVADYIVFMGYDQYGTTKIGTTSSYSWLKNNIDNFLTYEEVPAEKLILGLPFYTKLWQTQGDTTIKATVVGMNNVESSIPSDASKEWQEDLQQYYVQYERNGYTFKMWVEDEESFTKKIKLVEQNNLAGAAYWRKGFETNNLWNIIKQELSLK